ncbi:unnamed protein product [Orchesella dallaii]|uniref:RING-type domain-containing protein n=1 Tax=Orchesella dallaii TaxID=48710 RepID=A0ABP1RKQ4_9HEXA
MGQKNSRSQIVELTSIEVTHQADNLAMDEGEYSGLSLAAALGRPDDVFPSTSRMSAEDKKAAEEALTHTNSKLKVVVKKTGLNFMPGKAMISDKQIDACENMDVLKKQCISVMQELNKAEMQVTNTELQTKQERLQSEKLAKAIAIQNETEQAKKVTITSIFEKEFKCRICRQTFIHPTVTDCGHTFCRFCINESQCPHCPTCKSYVRKLIPNFELANFIDTITSQQHAEAKEARRIQTKTREEEEEASRMARPQLPEKTGRDEAERRPTLDLLRIALRIQEGVASMQ